MEKACKGLATTAPAFAAVAAFLGGAPCSANAQGAPASTPPSAAPAAPRPATGPLRHGGRGLAAAAAGRAAMKAGDCKTALDEFDRALLVSVDPTVKRDRGRCHETVGDPYPAIDDFQAYLTAYPDAPDAEDIRGRLRTLLAQVGRGGDAASTPADDDAPPSVDAAEVETTTGKEAAGTDLTAVEKREAETDAATGSPLRLGRGFIVGPYINLRYWGASQYGTGEAYGVALRYSLGRTYTVLGELGYSSINGSSGAEGAGGLSTFLGIEGRVPLDHYVTNALFFGGGLGYERPNQASTNFTFSTILPRVRGGYRHVFGPSLGLELGADVGYAMLSLVNPPDGGSASAQSLVVGLNVAFLVGF